MKLELKVGQHWQGNPNNLNLKYWKKDIILEIFDLSYLDSHNYFDVKYLYNRFSHWSVNDKIYHVYTNIIDSHYYRLIRTCRYCYDGFEKDHLDAEDGFMICWKCEISI